jgi:hypothetical protein
MHARTYYIMFQVSGNPTRVPFEQGRKTYPFDTNGANMATSAPRAWRSHTAIISISCDQVHRMERAQHEFFAMLEVDQFYDVYRFLLLR